MAGLKEKEYTYFQTVRGMCRRCRRIVPARVFFRHGQVCQQSLCPDCDNDPVWIAADQNWYLSHILKGWPDHSPLPNSTPPRAGCPRDCGPCSWHASLIQRRQIRVTGSDNLRTSVSGIEGGGGNIHPPIGEVETILNRIAGNGGPVDSIEILGEESLSHPAILDMIRLCKRHQVRHLAVHFDGILLAGNAALCRQLADLQVEVLLDCDTLDPRISRTLRGRDITDLTLAAIDNLGRGGATMTLMSEIIAGLNEGVARDALNLMRRHNHILGARIQVITPREDAFGRSGYLPVDEAVRIVCRSCESLKSEDFLPWSSAHPLCYLVCWMRKKDSLLEPGARFKPAEEQAQGIFGTFNDKEIRSVFIHSPMTAGTFDCSRAMRCPEMLSLQTGRLVPACLYGLQPNGDGGRHD